MTEPINWGEVVVPVGLVGRLRNYTLAQENILFCALIEDLTVAKNMGRKATAVYVNRELFHPLRRRYWNAFGPITTVYRNRRRVWHIDGVEVRWTKGREPYYLWGIGGKT